MNESNINQLFCWKCQHDKNLLTQAVGMRSQEPTGEEKPLCNEHIDWYDKEMENRSERRDL